MVHHNSRSIVTKVQAVAELPIWNTGFRRSGVPDSSGTISYASNVSIMHHAGQCFVEERIKTT